MADLSPTSSRATSRRLLPWIMYAGGVAVAVVIAGFFLGWFGGGDPSATTAAPTPATTTAPTPTTTTAPTPATTAAPTSTAAPATTVAPTTSMTGSSSASLLTDNFDGSTTAFQLFPLEFMNATIDDENRLWLTGYGADEVRPMMYPEPYPDVDITFQMYPLADQPNAKYGAMVLADIPAGGLNFFVLVYVDPADGNVWVKHWDGAEFVDAESEPIPAGFATEIWNGLRLVVSGSSVEVYLNDEFVIQWSGNVPSTPAWWGPMIISGDESDAMLIDNVEVLRIAG